MHSLSSIIVLLFGTVLSYHITVGEIVVAKLEMLWRSGVIEEGWLLTMTNENNDSTLRCNLDERNRTSVNV